jgi:hypothetical protein
MNTQEISNGLLQLGFTSGWAVSGNEIVLWEHNVPQPSEAEILEASNLWNTKENEAAEEAKVKRQALLERLGITQEEAKLLLGGN